MNGRIFNIQRFCTGDGPGIRTTVFLKGCPLSCAWCHNPESQSVHTQIVYNPEKCIFCGECAAVCGKNAHVFEENGHDFIRENCVKCMKCTEVCMTKAIEKCGETKSADEIIEIAERDAEFYIQSDGGVTLSGGEPLMQYDFSVEILKKLKEKGFHTAVETSGFCFGNLGRISKYTDLWLYDIKILEPHKHKKYTGVSNKIIIKNLYDIDSMGAKTVLRCPIIPNVNLCLEHFDGIAELANSLKNICSVQFEPYHPLGIDKSERLGSSQKYNNKSFLASEEVEMFAEKIRNKIRVSAEVL